MVVVVADEEAAVEEEDEDDMVAVDAAAPPPAPPAVVVVVEGPPEAPTAAILDLPQMSRRPGGRNAALRRRHWRKVPWGIESWGGICYIGRAEKSAPPKSSLQRRMGNVVQS